MFLSFSNFTSCIFQSLNYKLLWKRFVIISGVKGNWSTNNNDEAREPFRSDCESWKGESSDEEEIYDDGTEEVVSDEEDMHGFSNKDVEYDKDSTSERDSYNDGESGEESGSDSGRDSEGHIEGEKHFDDKSSDENSDGFYNSNDEDVEEQQMRFASLNENALNFHVTKGMSYITMFLMLFLLVTRFGII